MDNDTKLICETYKRKVANLISEGFNPAHPWSFTTKEPGAVDVDINSVPVTLDSLLSPKTEYLAGGDEEGLRYIADIRKSAKLEAARKVPGFNAEFRRSNNPNDFIYEVVISYDNPDFGRASILFGVSADGKRVQVFMS